MGLPNAFATTPPGSLWRATAPDTPPNPSLAGEAEADVTIIGAGYTGLRAALALAEAGLRVIVLEAGDVGSGASGRTGGQVNPMLPFNSPEQTRKLVGDRIFDRLAEQSLGSADEIFALIKTYQIECQARQNGWLRVHHSKAAQRKATADIADWNAIGAEMRVVDRDEVAALSGSTAYRTGTVNPRGGAVHPMMFVRGLAAAGQARGVAIHGQSAVRDLSKDGATWVVRTDAGSVRSDWVVVATNGYSGDLVKRLDKSILPVSPIQIASDPLPDDVIGSVLPRGHTISDSRRVIMYARREPDNRMVYGGHGEPDRNGTLGGFDWLMKDVARVFPQLRDVKWTYRWGGNIAVTEDHLPHLHEPQAGLIVGLGYNGRGVAMSNVMGRVMAERILGAPPEDLPFPVTDVAGIPMRRLKMVGMKHVIRWMKFLDYLETR
ncbi:NAD(P)/FAD-dependent oxidoreductase [Jannaschia sp. CCS1]|uniref:NAD(P)/FAD-dependent oxidoreductase n=1 Tax=Jannaschia sp. (strain CCS1) TaxID=290400 RepID=UPI000053B027|nr:FAD-binding oxidoreductase [Jannaschia sp. CCS1]ABD56868.1 FAD dependent oxidoreductase [Jannaschia sp. CCS1]